MTTKSDTISEIMRINPTVNSAFLAGFSADQLGEYLQRLHDIAALRPAYVAPAPSNAKMRSSTQFTAGAA